MQQLGRRLLALLIGLVAFAAVMLVLTFAVKDIGAVAARLVAGNDALRSMGRPGMVLVGLLAPIVFFFQRAGQWLKDVLGGSSPKEAALAQRTEELERRLDRIREEVAQLDRARAEELSKAQARVQKLEEAIGTSRQALASSDSAVDALVERLANPQRTKTDAELFEEAGRSPYFDPGVEITEGGRP